MKHTPGPWEFDEESNLIISDENLRMTANKLAYGRSARICKVHANLKASEANARLIAAAPCLLEALKGLLSLDDDHQRGADDQDVCLEVRNARAAIAKATGEQQ